MRFYWLLIGTLAVWRLTHLFSAEDGPWNVIVWIRRKAGGGFWGKLLDCFYCLSLWVAAPFAIFIGESVKESLFLWLAFSAGAILLNRATSNEPAPAAYFEHEGEDNVLLRKSESSGSGENSGSIEGSDSSEGSGSNQSSGPQDGHASND